MTLPLSTMLSQALVAFTIETDYEFEQQMPHNTTDRMKAGKRVQDPEPGVFAPWLISLAFWSACLRHVPEEGTTVGEVLDRGFLQDSFLLGTNPGMVRWGYLRLEPGDCTTRRPNRSWLVHLTPAGRKAQQIWEPLPGMVESRWAKRWKSVGQLRHALVDLVGGFDHALPDQPLPIMGGRGKAAWLSRPPAPVSRNNLYGLLSKALAEFTIEVEKASPLPLGDAANVARVLMDGPMARRDLPRATGVAKEWLAVMVGRLEKRHVVTSKAGNAVELTANGRDAAAATFAEVAEIEARWRADALREALEPLVGDGTLAGSALRVAIEPPVGTWRHSRPVPATLPHHPVVTHRGGFPDGS